MITIGLYTLEPLPAYAAALKEAATAAGKQVMIRTVKCRPDYEGQFNIVVVDEKSPWLERTREVFSEHGIPVLTLTDDPDSSEFAELFAADVASDDVTTIEETAPGEYDEVATADILGMSAKDIVTAVGGIDSPDKLRALNNAEHEGKNRSTVIRAINNRYNTLASSD